MQYARNTYDARDVLWNRVPLLRGGGGGVLTVGYQAYAVLPPGFALVPWIGMAEASAALTVSFRPTTPMTDYTSWASPKHLMCPCFPRAPLAQRVLALRECVHKRRLAKRFGACTVGTAAVGVAFLKSAPLKYRCLRMSHWNSHMVVLSSTNPNALAVAKALPAAYRTVNARAAWLQVICKPVGAFAAPFGWPHLRHGRTPGSTLRAEGEGSLSGLWAPPPHTNNW